MFLHNLTSISWPGYLEESLDYYFHPLKDGTLEFKFDPDFSIADEYKDILLVKGATKEDNEAGMAMSFMQEKFPEKKFRYAALVKEADSIESTKNFYYAYEVKNLKIENLAWHAHAPEWFDPHKARKNS